MIKEIYADAVEFAHMNKQVIHYEKSKVDGEYFITLRQLEDLLKVYTE